ncbi:hypothetical protein C8R47DRAFT_1061657 [Mycena vitilis]|nr:hypothetical protein C8R47DRAFT_1061657 [Mycena vitilis]
MNNTILPYNLRPSESFDIENRAHRVARYNAWTVARCLANENPLRSGNRFGLTLDMPRENLDPRSRHVPLLPIISSPGSTVTLQLHEVLQGGSDGFSQVWTARPLCVPGTILVMKMIQPSMCPCPHPDDDAWKYDYQDPFHLAHHEAWAYGSMAEKQGLLIPYFFGLHTIVTPSGESAWVLVLELITGQTVGKVRLIPVIQDFCTLGISAMDEFSRSGWKLADIRCPNFILTSDGKQVVIIDLYGAELSSGEPKLFERVVADQLRTFYITLHEVVDQWYPGFESWAKTQPHFPRFLFDYSQMPSTVSKEEHR